MATTNVWNESRWVSGRYLHVKGQVPRLGLLQITLRVLESHLQTMSLRLNLTQLCFLSFGFHLLLSFTHKHSANSSMTILPAHWTNLIQQLTLSSSVSFSFLSFSLSTAFSSQRRALAFRSLAPPEITPDFWNNVPSRATVYRIHNMFWTNKLSNTQKNVPVMQTLVKLQVLDSLTVEVCLTII